MRQNIIAARAAVFVWVVSFARFPAACGPVPDRLNQARHLAAAAAAVGVVAVLAEAAGHEKPVLFPFLFLVGRELHPPVLHRPEARSADEVLVVRLLAVGLAQPRP